MLTDAAIIGGTGVGDVLAARAGQAIHVPTRSGQLSGKLIDHDSGPILLVSRHSAGHKVPPHKVKYEAIVRGLKVAGVRFCFSTAAVGSVRRDWRPGTLVAISDFADLSGRMPTLFNDAVTHTDFSFPFSPSGRHALKEAADELGMQVKTEGVYICENGPRYETPHEIEGLARVGDVVGMTAATEAILMREAQIDYACLALVTNLAAGLGALPLSHEGVVDQMKHQGQDVVKLLLRSVDLMRSAP